MNFSVPMAIIDFIPVFFFAATSFLLQKDLYRFLPKGAYALMACGQMDIVCAGGLKAVYKLLYATGICDFQALNTLFFPLQAIGFFFAGMGVVGFFIYKKGKFYELKFAGRTTDARTLEDAIKEKKENTLHCVGGIALLAMVAVSSEPEYFSGTMLFVFIMVLGMALVSFGMSYLAFRIQLIGAIFLFILSFFFSLCMGYISSGDFSQSYMNWIAEATNVLGQGFLFWGTCLIHKVLKKEPELIETSAMLD